MTFFVFLYMAVTISVCLYIQWQVTALLLLAIPLLIGTRLVFSRVKENGQQIMNSSLLVVLQNNGNRVQAASQNHKFGARNIQALAIISISS